MNPGYQDESPIASFATIPGESALAVIRTSGAGAVGLLSGAFSRPKKLLESPGNTLIHGWITGGGGEAIDEVVVSVFRGPRSYTGEDCLDISCHGGGIPARAVMARLLALGFRQALPGEFTFRAFMNGKLDLTRSESVMELVSAKTDVSRKNAIGRLSGSLEREIKGIRELLVAILARAELFLDYSEDDGIGLEKNGNWENEEADGRLPDSHLAEEAALRLRALAASYRIEKLCQDGAFVVIAGQPNAGKSSLFNRLLKEERSIVTETPGTTRDWIESQASLEGIPLRLADTAGLHVSRDPVESLGIEQSRRLIAGADIVLYLIDGKTGVREEDLAFLGETDVNCNGAAPRIILWNKIDESPLPPSLKTGWNHAIIGISAKTGDGLPELHRAMLTCLAGKEYAGEAGQPAPAGEGPAASGQSQANCVPPGRGWEARLGTACLGTARLGTARLGTARQKDLVDAALAAVDEALESAARREPLDIIAPMLRGAINALGEITGEVSSLDILDTIFSRFCVGK